jgi:hypothetical protein
MCAPVMGTFWSVSSSSQMRIYGSLFRSSDMPKKIPRRIYYGQTAPHHVAHILGAYTATIWAMAGALGDTIPVLSHDQNIA